MRLPPDIVQFLNRPVPIGVASVSPAGQPVSTRGLGAIVTQSGGTVLVSAPQSEALLEAVGRGGEIAVVFADMGDLQTVQIKAPKAILAAPTDEELKVAAGYRVSFEAAMSQVGFSAARLRGLWGDQLVALHFKATEVYNQTPGPGAGDHLEGDPWPS